MSQKWMCVNMGMFVNPDNLAFQAALNAKIYVDKSGILNYTNSVLGSTDAFICNSRPRRFGKSVTANMLTAYYSKGCDSEEMFSRLEISQAEDFRKHLNQYDVIHFDVQWCMMDAGRMAPYVGFTEAEVHDLFAERKRGNATVVSPKRKYCRSSLLLLFWITAEKLSL